MYIRCMREYQPGDRFPRRRFLRHVVEDGHCWGWVGSYNRGYGVISFKGRTYTAQRISLNVFCGFDLSSPLVTHHLCSNKGCVNPRHLVLMTRREHTSYHHSVE